MLDYEKSLIEDFVKKYGIEANYIIEVVNKVPKLLLSLENWTDWLNTTINSSVSILKNTNVTITQWDIEWYTEQEIFIKRIVNDVIELLKNIKKWKMS